MIRKSPLLLCLFCSTTLLSQTFIASNENVFITPNVSSADVGDYDNDGDLDIIIMGLDNSLYYTQIYNNDGLGNFSLSNIDFQHQYRNGQVEFIDYDNDNDLDIFISGIAEDETKLSRLYKNTNANFTEVAFDFGGNIINNQFFWSDYDNDGDLDVILMGDVETQYSTSFVYRNDGNDQFTNITSTVGGFSQGEIKAVDLDNDGDDDILVTGFVDFFSFDELLVYRNNGDFNFEYVLTLEGFFNGDLEVTDANGDGFIDIFKTGNMDNDGSITTTSKLFINSGNFSFSEFTDTVFPSLLSNHSQAEIADFNGSGENDFLLIGMIDESQGTAMASIFENQGNLSLLENNSTGIIPSFYYDLESADFDNDHDIDLFATNHNFSNVFVNQGTIANTIPSPPSSLQAQVSDNNVVLLWNNGTDSESPEKQLTYNIYVGTSTGNTDVVTPMANLNSGYRKVVGIGNAQYRNQTVLNNLPNGTYYWAVQSIDSQYEGSQFSSEHTFTISDLNVEDLDAKLSVKYYPNPVNHQLIISTNKTIHEVTLNTVLGEKLRTITVDGLLDFNIDFREYSSGIYFVTLKSQYGEKQIKVVKE